MVPWPGSSARQRTNTIRWGEMVTGGGEGAAIENITPVRSKRVDGPGHLTHIDALDEEGGHDVHAPKVAVPRPT